MVTDRAWCRSSTSPARGQRDLTAAPRRRPRIRRPAAVGPGVYRFRDAVGQVLYVGRALDLRRRVGSYWSDLGGRRGLRRMVERIDAVEVVVCDSGAEAAWLERNLLDRSLPRWNRARGGQESEVFLRLDLSGNSTGVHVVHESTQAVRHRDFGPYLGGTQARLAASALNRIYPIGYASVRLDGADRELAHARSIRPGDRDVLVERVIAVLTRTPAAMAEIQIALGLRRDDGLAFELAGRIQAESSAIGWVTADQKVTSDVLGDAVVAGWADGLLLELGVRAGRMQTRTLRECDDAAARDLAADTPPTWRRFVQRNVDLAVQLRRHPH